MIRSFLHLVDLLISAIFVKLLFYFVVLGFVCRIRRRRRRSSGSSSRRRRRRPIRSHISSLFITIATMCLRRKSNATSKVHNHEVSEELRPGSRCRVSFVDLPDLVLETILSKLSPEMLCKMSSVSKDLYKRSSCDHLWKHHVASKWNHVAGPAAFKEWLGCGLISPYRLSDDVTVGLCKPSLIRWSLSCLWSQWWDQFSSSSSSSIGTSCRTMDRADSDDAHVDDNLYVRWYSALQSGAFWFPAQVYNREHGHIGFLLSCYDAELCYDRHSDTFTARYPPHGSCSLLVEEGVPWQRLRAPPVSATAHELYLSQSLDDLRPGDHVEVQWRRSKKFPYGWWYGVVGHLDTCDEDLRTCCCHLNDVVWLEFNQYSADSRWRRTSIDRKNHQEKGNDAEGYYAGIRKLEPKDISTWKQLWPTEPLE